jgi:hypothetical protein
MCPIELSEDVKELLTKLIKDDTMRRLIFLIESGENEEKILEELIKVMGDSK